MKKIIQRSASMLITLSILLVLSMPVLASPLEPEADFYETIIRQHGSIHCLTMQLPEGAIK